MSGSTQQQSPTSLVQMAKVRAVVVDELSSVRHLHVAAVRQLAAAHLSEGEAEALAAYMRSELHTERLIEAVRNGRLLAVDLMGTLAATAGWLAATDASATARIFALAVSPLYARQGLARLVLAAAEADAQRAGFTTFTVRTPVGGIGFLERMRYSVTSHGVWPLPGNQAVPVGFLRKVAGKSAA